MAARKPWKSLSAAYRRRMESHGLNARNWSTKKGDALRKAARGHSQTPERPSQAAKNPGKFQAYNQRRQTLLASVQARKDSLWGNRHKYRKARAHNNVVATPGTNQTADATLMRRFLRMTPDEAESMAARVGALINKENHASWVDEWSFLFYH